MTHDIFDNQILCQAIKAGFRIGEIPIPTRYHAEQHTLPLISLKGFRFIFESCWIILLYLLHKTKK